MATREVNASDRAELSIAGYLVVTLRFVVLVKFSRGVVGLIGRQYSTGFRACRRGSVNLIALPLDSYARGRGDSAHVGRMFTESDRNLLVSAAVLHDIVMRQIWSRSGFIPWIVRVFSGQIPPDSN